MLKSPIMVCQSTEELPRPLDILGVNVFPFRSYEHVIACLRHRIASGAQSFCVAINPEKVFRALSERELRVALAQAELAICDGIGISVAARILYGKKLDRCTGIDLFEHLISAAAEEGWRVFLLGASEEANRRAAENLARKYPRLVIAGRHSGYFSQPEAILEQINGSSAHLLFVAMGSPRQEFWITKYRARLNVKLCMGVGGTFDIFSGLAPRAPAMFRRTGTEFLYRLITTPSRCRRQACYPIFILKVIKERLAQTLRRERPN
jgi:N-acetylglucosaminyldiphosphoundecaprenol N-acetyl-beta-D-mannosaminyltransferase